MSHGSTGSISTVSTHGKYDTAALIDADEAVVTITSSLDLWPNPPASNYLDTIEQGLSEADIADSTVAEYIRKLRSVAA